MKMPLSICFTSKLSKDKLIQIMTNKQNITIIISFKLSQTQNIQHNGNFDNQQMHYFETSCQC